MRQWILHLDMEMNKIIKMKDNNLLQEIKIKINYKKYFEKEIKL